MELGTKAREQRTKEGLEQKNHPPILALPKLFHSIKYLLVSIKGSRSDSQPELALWLQADPVTFQVPLHFWS